MSDLEVIIPTHIILPRKTKKDKSVPLSMNWYRNAYHHESNQVKQLVKSLVAEHLIETGQDKIFFHEPVTVTWKMYKPRKNRTDKSNFFSVSSKFVYDALVELEVLEDDNDEFIFDEHLHRMEHDKDNPRIIFQFKIAD